MLVSLVLQNKHPDALILLARKAIDIWDYFGKIIKMYYFQILFTLVVLSYRE